MSKKKVKKAKKGKGKVKTEGSSEKKVDKDSDFEKIRVNVALLETKLNVAENSRVEYREEARKLARANEVLTDKQDRAKKDALDIIDFIKKEEIEKEDKITQLEEQLKCQKKKALEENKELIERYTTKISQLQEKFNQRADDFVTIQVEMQKIQEFRRNKAQMDQEFNDLKERLSTAEKEHREVLFEMEHKFFSEKISLERKAEERIAQLAERAHNEAVMQLDEASRSVFKENVRLSQSLSYHMKEVSDLRKKAEALVEENASLVLDKETSELSMKDNAHRLMAQKKTITELKRKVAELERALDLATDEFARDQDESRRRGHIGGQAAHGELEKLQQVLAMREREMGRVKRLARSLVAERTELERFFHEALAQVKEEIVASQAQYRRQAQAAFRRRMKEAWEGGQEYPPIRTFHKTLHSTNNVYAELEEAEKWTNLPSSKVDISDLTWEQKEKVLRLLFAKMNGLKAKKSSRPLTLSAPCEENRSGSDAGILEEQSHEIFLTQKGVPEHSPNPCSLPEIRSATQTA